MSDKKIPITSLDLGGRTDEFSYAVINDEGLFIEGYFHPSVGLEWEQLAKLLRHEAVREKLEEAEMLLQL